MADPIPGVLLLNVGTPDGPSVPEVRKYLREFLMDPRVIDLALPLRWLLVHGLILPTRPAKSAAAYRAVWGPRGSPLLQHSEDLRDALQAALGGRARVAIGMRYGNPSIAAALDSLLAADVSEIIVLPMFPQYAAASTGTALERVMELAGARWNVPPLRVLPAFYDDAGFLDACASVASRALADRGLTFLDLDHVLMSFHGLPERHCRRSDPTGMHCLSASSCCDAIVAANRHCYRAQCFATARALAQRLQLPAERWSIAFQSRLGRTPWIQPHTDVVLAELGQRRLQRVAVLEPSFVADCLETVEEIGIRGREVFAAHGGGELLALPCVNADPAWVAAVLEMTSGMASRPFGHTAAATASG